MPSLYFFRKALSDLSSVFPYGQAVSSWADPPIATLSSVINMFRDAMSRSLSRMDTQQSAIWAAETEPTLMEGPFVERAELVHYSACGLPTYPSFYQIA